MLDDLHGAIEDGLKRVKCVNMEAPIAVMNRKIYVKQHMPHVR